MTLSPRQIDAARRVLFATAMISDELLDPASPEEVEVVKPALFMLGFEFAIALYTAPSSSEAMKELLRDAVLSAMARQAVDDQHPAIETVRAALNVILEQVHG